MPQPPASAPPAMPALARRRLLAGLLALPALAPRTGRAAAALEFDQRHATVEFAVAALGLFDLTGRFPHFAGRLQLDPARPEAAALSVALDMRAVEMDDPGRTALLRSAEFFDTARYPEARYDSQTFTALGAGRYALRGVLAMRGTAQPLRLEAALRDRRAEPGGGGSIAFQAGGALSRAAFGMVAEPVLSDTVRLSLRLRLPWAG